MKKFLWIVIAFAGVSLIQTAGLHAEEDTTPIGVTGCAAIQVDPEASLEDQQTICNAAEGNPNTSCAASNNGTCSSPKRSDVSPDATHCVCIGETDEVAVLTEEEPLPPLGELPAE